MTHFGEYLDHPDAHQRNEPQRTLDYVLAPIDPPDSMLSRLLALQLHTEIGHIFNER